MCPRSTSPRPDGTALPRGPGRPVPDAADRWCRAACPGTQLLTVLGAWCRHLPDQRQAGAARHRQHLSEPQPATRARSWTLPHPVASSSSTTAPARSCSSRPIGVTRVLSMLHQLAAGPQQAGHPAAVRGTRTELNSFAGEAHALLASLPHAREHVFYSAATPPSVRVLTPPRGRLTKETLDRLGHPGRRERLRLRASPVHGRHAGAPSPRSASTRPRIHTELFGALPLHQSRAHRAAGAGRPTSQPGPPGTGPVVTFARSGITTHSATTSTACSTLPTAATSPPAGAAARASATRVSRLCYPAASPTPRPHWNYQPTGRCSSAAPGPPRDIVLDM